MEPNDDGECEDGYTMGDDGMCHLMPMKGLAHPKSRATLDRQQQDEARARWL